MTNYNGFQRHISREHAIQKVEEWLADLPDTFEPAAGQPTTEEWQVVALEEGGGAMWARWMFLGELQALLMDTVAQVFIAAFGRVLRF